MENQMSNRFYPNTGKVLSTHNAPVMVDCNFIVDSTNGNGLGIRSLKGNGVANAFMHTSSTPAVGNGNFLNPNPASGYAVIQMADNYNRLYTVDGGFVSPLTGSNLTSITAGLVYVIVVLGTATQAQWQALGLLPGVTPALGAAFVAASTGAIPGSGAVKLSSNSGISAIEVIGDSNQTIAPVGIIAYPGIGAQIILQFLGATDADTTTLIPKAPADGSVCSLSFLFSNSSVQVAGE